MNLTLRAVGSHRRFGERVVPGAAFLPPGPGSLLIQGGAHRLPVLISLECCPVCLRRETEAQEGVVSLAHPGPCPRRALALGSADSVLFLSRAAWRQPGCGRGPEG